MEVRWQQHQKRGIRFSSSFLICLTLCFVSTLTAAASKNILILASKNTSTYQHVIKNIKTNITTNNSFHLNIAYASDSPSALNIDSYDLLITIGTDATKQALTTKNRPPIISALIPKRSFDLLAATHQPDIISGRLTALYLDQPLQRQLKLLKLVAPETKSIGTILSDSSKSHLPALTAIAQQQQLTLNTAELLHTDSPVEALTPIINNSDAFLALPDRAIFNRGTAKWILLMTFRQRIPLIAFSKSYVDAGALAAIYSTPQTVGEEAALLITGCINQPTDCLPKPAYPQRFDISINQGTARSLQLKLPSQQLLKTLLTNENIKTQGGLNE